MTENRCRVCEAEIEWVDLGEFVACGCGIPLCKNCGRELVPDDAVYPTSGALSTDRTFWKNACSCPLVGALTYVATDDDLARIKELILSKGIDFSTDIDEFARYLLDTVAQSGTGVEVVIPGEDRVVAITAQDVTDAIGRSL
jgi:hypothetical protein